jgi:hypothetical protein
MIVKRNELIGSYVICNSTDKIVSTSSSGVNEMLLDAIPKPAFQKHLVTTAGSIAFWAEIIHETASSTVTLLVNSDELDALSKLASMCRNNFLRYWTLNVLLPQDQQVGIQS